MNDSLREFQQLLRTLFQFDVADLDFGVYRILNQKRDDIEDFIQVDLVEAVREELGRLETEQEEDLRKHVAERKQAVINNLGPDALEGDQVADDYAHLPAAQAYEEARQELEAARLSEETERRIYDDLARFFGRYYDNGDFVTKRRFASHKPKYFVPYNGEEVHLHWANRDQYYVKTSEHFTDYRFDVADYTVHFELVDAEMPQDNVKASDTRYFVLQGDKPVRYDEDSRKLTIRFAFRPLTEAEDEELLERYNEQQTRKSDRRKTSDRRTINAAQAEIILDQVDDPTLKAHLAQAGDDEANPPLLKHLNRYSARNTTDYFVHKDLGGFLRSQLDFYLKNEVMGLDDVLGDESGQIAQHAVARTRVVKRIGERIIDFLAQIEDFQRRLFEKKKFVVETNYCVTLDQVPDELYPEILENDDQKEAWRELYRLDQWDEDLMWQGAIDEAFLENHPYLMIDTAYFDQDFTDRLLASFDDLDEARDGLLMQGDNFQALNLLQKTFREQIECTYIDPPYNTGNDDFIYKDKYQHSTWLTMMENRLSLSKKVLSNSGSFFVSIDDGEQDNLRKLLDERFGTDNLLAHIVWQKRYVSNATAKYLSDMHDHLLFYALDKEYIEVKKWPRTEEQLEAYRNPDDDPRGQWRPQDLSASKPYSAGQYTITTPAGKEVNPPPGRYWRCSKEQYEEWIEDDRIWFGVNGTGRPMLKGFLSESQQGVTPHTWWSYDFAGHNKEAKLEIKKIFGDSEPYSTPKPVKLITRILDTTKNKGVTLDYFAGSGTTGHAVMNLNREDDGAREYILVEMGDYFDTVMLPRLMKVAFTPNWKDGVPQDRDGQSHFIKYQRLESYEDALNNIHIHEPEEAQQSLIDETFDDYRLRYMLDYETKESPSLLTEDAFDDPFEYKLSIQRGHASPEPKRIDLVETFNYLIGLRVRQRRAHFHQGRRYVSVRGDIETEDAIEEGLVLWRKTEGLDLDKEADWAEEELLGQDLDRIYVNGPSHISGAEPLEMPFRHLMDAEVTNKGGMA